MTYNCTECLWNVSLRAERALGEVRVVAERGRLEVEVPVLGLAIAEVRDVGEH